MIRAASAYIENRGKVLTIKRESGKYKGWLALPHGIVERGETPLIAVIRETSEEVGLNIKVIKELLEYEGKFGHRHGKYSNLPVLIHIFKCEIIGGTLKTRFNPDWISKVELLARDDVVPSLKKVLSSC